MTYSWLLPDLLTRAGFDEVGVPALIVHGLRLDSRQVEPGDVFVAVRGTHQHGARFARDAVAAGASVILTDQFAPDLDCGVPVVSLDNLRDRCGLLASVFFGKPSERLSVGAVTGTNGKTSVTFFAAQMAATAGLKSAVIGTLGYGQPNRLRDSQLTTPDAITIHRWLATLVDDGYQAVFLEASSHALDQERLAGVNIRSAAFTNLSQDHLDYHGDLGEYFTAKRRLFTRPELLGKWSNLEDEHGRQLVDYGGARGYSTRDASDLLATDLSFSADGFDCALHYRGEHVTLRTSLIGRFNVSNVLAAAGLCLDMGVTLPDIAAAAPWLRPPPGRMQCLGGGDHPQIVIDYAHTPQALATAITTLRAHQPRQLTVVFGAGGDRDAKKRAPMGAAACAADRVWITDDNPRTEDGDRIVRDIQAGMSCRYQVERDRAHAIATAVAEASRGDIVLIAGKGHEDYQIVGERRLPFSDLEQAQRALERCA